MPHTLSVCTQPGCPELTDGGRCETHRTEARRQSDKRRPNAQGRGYGSKWQRTRAKYLRIIGVCELTLAGCTVEATEVDHIDGLGPTGPRGHDPTNLRAACHSCHAKRTAAEQPGGWHGTAGVG